MQPTEIVLPQTKPETEWIRGRALRKVSPTRSHALVQRLLGTELAAWAEGSGEVGTEWRFRVAPPGEAIRPLVPDVSFVRSERLYGLSGRDLEYPQLSPDVVVEVLSPDDRREDVDDKIATYLRAGSSLVFIADPATRTVELHDAEKARVLAECDIVEHPALPGFALPISKIFAELIPKRGTNP